MIDIDKYEETDHPELVEFEGETLGDTLTNLLAEVKRLRKELEKAKQERDKYDGALNIALEHLGYQGADHDWFCKEKYQCNVYGDDLEDEEE